MSNSIDVQSHKGTLRSQELWRHYFDEFTPLKDKPVKLLELGIFHGRSLHVWKEFFTEGFVSGIDERIPLALGEGPRGRYFKGSQHDTEFLDHVARKVAPDGFDIIIDDCSHLGWVTKISFWHLFERCLKPGGIYVIEDWRTGYRSDWEDGEVLACDPRDVPPTGNRFHGHQVGMVGFVKELVDEFARPASGSPDVGSDVRCNPISRLTFFEHQVFVYKRAADEAAVRAKEAA
jgi:SAM-dependent methyltransferase